MKKLLFLLITTVVFYNSAVSQCPMCKTALKSNITSSKKTTVGNGINKGILFLLSTPYVLVGAGLFLYFRRKKSQQI